VAEILFYHLQRQPLDVVLPKLIERSLERGWKAVVQAVTAERLAALDDLLWTYSEESFLPHATDRDPDASREPIVLTVGDSNPNEATVRFLVEGAALPADPEAYERLVILFDGQDDDALAAARKTWSGLKAGGLTPTYWQQDETGRWEKKA
jgi:DNA polymerase III subunit chi